MEDQLSDRQLAVATWMYERRLVFERIALALSVVCAIGLLGAVAAKAALHISSYEKHRILILSETQNAILASDPALQFSPLPLSVSAVAVIPQSERRADAYGSIINPNASWAAFSARYYFTSRGTPITEPRETFALPGENAVAGFAKNVELLPPFALVVENAKWRKIVLPIERERLRLFSFESRDVVFAPGDAESVDARVAATIVNKSPFGLWNAPITALLYHNDSLVGIGEYALPQFSSGEERSVVIGVSNAVSSVTDIFIVPRVNMLDDRFLML